MERPILFEQGNLKVRWEDTYINIPFNFEDSREIVLYRLFREMSDKIENMQKEINILKLGSKDYIRYNFDKVSHTKAKNKILTFLKEIKKKTEHITLFEISQHLKLPADQVEVIIDELEKDGRIKWVEK